MREQGYEPVAAPILRVERLRSVTPPGPHDAIVLTSANAARLAIPPADPSVPVHAIGERTAGAAREAGFARVTVGADGMPARDGAALGRALVASLAGRRVLYPCALQRRPGLERELSRTATVLAWPLYATVTEPDAAARIAVALGGRAPAATLVHSPTAAAALAGAELGGSAMLCLSAAIAAALHPGVGGERRVAPSPDERSLLSLLTVAGEPPE